MDKPLFVFKTNANALRYISKAFDKYVEKWPGGNSKEQEELKKIQLELYKALLDLQMIDN